MTTRNPNMCPLCASLSNGSEEAPTTQINGPTKAFEVPEEKDPATQTDAAREQMASEYGGG